MNTSGPVSVYSNGTMTALGTLGGTQSVGNGINDAGEVVGNSQLTGNTAPNPPFLYRHGSLINLASLLNDTGKGWTLENATAINNNRQIVGYGTNPHGQMDAFLLTPSSLIPTPIPGAVWLFGAGLLTLLWWRVRMA